MRLGKKNMFRGFRNKAFLNERGDFGIKEIAITVAVIVVIGSTMTIIKNDFLRGWIQDVWSFLWEKIQEFSS